MLFLSSSHESGHCFVETSSLDGESNLKIKAAIPAVQSVLWSAPRPEAEGGADQLISAAKLRQLDLSLDIEGPNAKFESFKGVLHLHSQGGAAAAASSGPAGAGPLQIPLKADHLLLRGTELRNTPSLLGLVVYTGVDSKIRRNVAGSASRVGGKKSGVMTRVNTLLVVMLCVQLALCFLGALLCFSWTDRFFNRAWYLHFTQSSALTALRSAFTYFIVLSQVVPISLLVSNELVKSAQAKFIAWSVDAGWRGWMGGLTPGEVDFLEKC
jgi:phospholipid-transporting ATPase